MEQRARKYIFPKEERLSSKKSIKELFSRGSSFFIYPFKVIYLTGNSPVPQVLFTVPKKSFKKAVDRNIVRRRLKEAYRLNKQIILPDQEKTLSLSIAFVYVAKEILPYKQLETKLKKCLLRLSQV